MTLKQSSLLIIGARVEIINVSVSFYSDPEFTGETTCYSDALHLRRDLPHNQCKEERWMTVKRQILAAVGAFLLVSGGVSAEDDLPFDASPVTSFDEPWALAFLPDGRMLVTEKKGNLFIVTRDGQKSRPVRGLPDVDYGGQGGLGDVAVHPDFTDTGFIYLSYAEGGIGGTRGAAVIRAVLNLTERGGFLSDTEVIWRQYPKVCLLYTSDAADDYFWV